MRFGGWAIALLAPWLLSACHQPVATKPSGVRAAAYDAFYVWPGVRPAKDIKPKILYLLDGEVRRGGPSRLLSLRMGVPRLPGKTLWLVVRADRLDWGEVTYAAVLSDLERWQKGGNNVVGLQIDFDAATRGIDRYAEFLSDVCLGDGGYPLPA